MFDGLFNLEKETTNKLIESGREFAKELGVPVCEIQVRILYAKDDTPYYHLHKAVDNGKGGKKWDLVISEKRPKGEIKLSEII